MLLLCVSQRLWKWWHRRNGIVPSPSLTLSKPNVESVWIKKWNLGTSLAVQWLGLYTFTAEVPGSASGRGTKILKAARCGNNKKKKKEVKFWVNSLKHFHCSGNNKVHMCVQAAKYKFCKFGDFPYELMLLWLHSELVFVQCKDEWQHPCS